MKAKNKRRLNRMMSIILVFMLMSYYVPIGLLVATAEGAGEDTGETGVFTLELLNDGNPLDGATVTGTNGNIDVSGTTNQSGIVSFGNVTIEDIEVNNTFNFEV